MTNDSNDIISLEELVGEGGDAAASSSQVTASAGDQNSQGLSQDVGAQASSESIGAAPSAGVGGSGQSPAPDGRLLELDRLLAVEDPLFAERMKDLSELGLGDDLADQELDGLVKQSNAEAGLRGWRKLVLFIFKKPARILLSKIFSLLGWIGQLPQRGLGVAKWALRTARALALAFFGLVKRLALGFMSFSGKSKLLVFASIALLVVALQVGRVVFKGFVLPTFAAPFIASFADIADEKYAIASGEVWENFNDPLFHPERVILVERIIVNLRREDDISNPMALVDLYIEGSSKTAAIELNDRELEVRDLIARTLEQMPYDEMIGLAGKEKFKVMIRKNLNGILSQGRVRRVFYKNIVIKS
jgi:flagellar basal body-associated protein FliL